MLKIIYHKLLPALPFINSTRLTSKYLKFKHNGILKYYDYIIWIALSPMFCVGAFVLDGIFIGITKIREMRNSLFFAGLVWITTLVITYESLGYHSIWLAMSAFMLSRAVFLGLYMFKVLEDFSKPEKAEKP